MGRNLDLRILHRGAKCNTTLNKIGSVQVGQILFARYKLLT